MLPLRAPEVGAPPPPALTGWQAHARPFAFEPEMEYADDAWRWLDGTPVIPALFAATEGPRMLREAGIERIRAKSVRQTARLIELADARGYPVTAPRDPERRGGTVAFDVPHALEVSQALLAHDVLVDYRPGAGIRVAPHFYTSRRRARARGGDDRRHSRHRRVAGARRARRRRLVAAQRPNFLERGGCGRILESVTQSGGSFLSRSDDVPCSPNDR